MLPYHNCCITRKAVLINKERGETTEKASKRFEELFETIETVEDYKRCMLLLAHQMLYVRHMLYIDHTNKLLIHMMNGLLDKLNKVNRANKWLFDDQNVDRMIVDLIKGSYHQNLTEQQISMINCYLDGLTGIFAMGAATTEPIVQYRFGRLHKDVRIFECNIFQGRFNGRCIEMYGVITSGYQYSSLAGTNLRDDDGFGYLLGFNTGTLKPRDIICIVSGMAPVNLLMSSPLRTSACAMTDSKLYYHIKLLDNNIEKNSCLNVYKLCVLLCERYNMDIRSADGLLNCKPSDVVKGLVVGCESIINNQVANIDSTLQLFKLFATNSSQVSLEADGEDDFSDEEEVDDTDEGSDTDDSTDTGDDEGGSSDDLGDDTEGDDTDTGEGDDGSDEVDDTDEGDDGSEGDTDAGDDTEEGSEEEPEPTNMPNLDKSDDKGVGIEIAKHENLDSVIYRLGLENQIALRLKDESLNNIQTAILKQLKNFWLHYWSIQSIDDTLTLVEKLG